MIKKRTQCPRNLRLFQTPDALLYIMYTRLQGILDWLAILAANSKERESSWNVTTQCPKPWDPIVTNNSLAPQVKNKQKAWRRPRHDPLQQNFQRLKYWIEKNGSFCNVHLKILDQPLKFVPFSLNLEMTGIFCSIQWQSISFRNSELVNPAMIVEWKIVTALAVYQCSMCLFTWDNLKFLKW